MTVVRHRFSCPLRWADLDLLGHVNNVRYVDYLRAARDDLVAAAGVRTGSAGLVVRRHELTFLAPLMFGRDPIVVESRFVQLDGAGAVLEQLVLGPGPEPVLHLRARSVVAPRGDHGTPRSFTTEEIAALEPYLDAAEPRPEVALVRVRAAEERHYPLHVRAGDLDVTGTASDVSFVEYFQEARIGFFDRLLHEGLVRGKVRWVVAQTDIDYLAPVTLRAAPYDCFTRLARVGNKSLTVESVVRDASGADLATARVVLVVFDPVANRSVEPPEGYREVLAAFVSED